MGNRVDLVRMRSGEQGIIIDIQGGYGLSNRLETLGIRLGVKIVKVSGQFARGPVTFQVNNTRASIGYGMAIKVIVELMQ